MASYAKTKKGITDKNVKWIVPDVETPHGSANLLLLKRGSRWETVADAKTEPLMMFIGEGSTIDAAVDAWVAHANATPVAESGDGGEPKENNTPEPVQESGESASSVEPENETTSSDVVESESPTVTDAVEPVSPGAVPDDVVRYAAKQVGNKVRKSVALCSAAQIKRISRESSIERIRVLRAEVVGIARESGDESIRTLCAYADVLMSNHVAVLSGVRGVFRNKKERQRASRRFQAKLEFVLHS